MNGAANHAPMAEFHGCQFDVQESRVINSNYDNVVSDCDMFKR